MVLEKDYSSSRGSMAWCSERAFTPNSVPETGHSATLKDHSDYQELFFKGPALWEAYFIQALCEGISFPLLFSPIFIL